MAEPLEVERIEILKGYHDGDPTPRWFVNMCFEDGSQIIIDDKSSYIEAWISALQDGVHVADLTRPTSPFS